MANPEKLHPNTYPNTKSAYASSAEELAARQTDTEAWFEALYTWLPGWIERFAQLPDPRHPGKIQHKLTVVLVYGVMLFLWQCASRRAGNRELTQPAVWETLQAAFPALETIPHMDTVARVLERLPAEHLESILLDTVKRLLRNRRLASWMVQQHYLVAVDGTLKWSAAYPWASEALTKQMKSGDPVYQAYVVEAVLVCPQGIAIPLMAEFCENAVDAAPATKQDSELKAFYRLARRLKAAFPRLKLAILADGLYPNGPLFRFLRAQRWDFIKGARLLKPPFSRGGYSGSCGRWARCPMAAMMSVRWKPRTSGRGGCPRWCSKRAISKPSRPTRRGSMGWSRRMSTTMSGAIAPNTFGGSTSWTTNGMIPRLAGSVALWCIMPSARKPGPMPKASITAPGRGSPLAPFRKAPS